MTERSYSDLPEGVADPYVLVGVTKDAGIKEIKKAYKKLALVHHPDKNRDDPKSVEKFQLVYAAYEFLTSEKRAGYDEWVTRQAEIRLKFEKLDAEKRKYADDLNRKEKEANDAALARRKEGQRVKLLKRQNEELLTSLKQVKAHKADWFQSSAPAKDHSTTPSSVDGGVKKIASLEKSVLSRLLQHAVSSSLQSTSSLHHSLCQL
eukprot:GHVU01032513.1.p1 GENE.GHVU01032513.1~~GHVU01032513.1.p1  ORF type:complete len:231 (+),score=41.11 GHVU01032513.1:77-694(+)